LSGNRDGGTLIGQQEVAMQLSIRSHAVTLDPDLRERAGRRAAAALGRFARLGRVTLTVADVNGPRGGDDKLCRLRVALGGRREVVIDARHATLGAAIDVACERAAQAVGRELAFGRRPRGAEAT
jgi:hypothetical protein